MAQVEPTLARENNDSKEIRSQQKPDRQKERGKESKKVGRQKGGQREQWSLTLLPNETLHHLFSFLQVFMMVS